jgi:hypothetical protein
MKQQLGVPAILALLQACTTHRQFDQLCAFGEKQKTCFWSPNPKLTNLTRHDAQTGLKLWKRKSKMISICVPAHFLQDVGCSTQ